MTYLILLERIDELEEENRHLSEKLEAAYNVIVTLEFKLDDLHMSIMESE